MRRLGQNLIAAIALLCLTAGFAQSDPMRSGMAAFDRGDYATAARIFMPLAERGNVRAQTYLGFMYAYGRGVPRNQHISASWYHRAAKRGYPPAQFALGVMYDRGQGVPENGVEAHRWLNLAASRARPREREHWERMRDAVASKLTPPEISEAEWRAFDWRPSVPR